METVDQLKLRKNWTSLLDNINPEDVIPYLIQDFVFDPDMADEIEAAETRKKKTRLMLTKLMRRGPSAYDCFRSALSQHEVYEHLIQRLDNTEIDPEILAAQENRRSDRPDLGITPVDEDTPSAPSPLRSSDSFSSSSSESKSEPSEGSQGMLPPPSSSSSSSSLPQSDSTSNFRIAGNHNFVIVGSSNTQVYYH